MFTFLSIMICCTEFGAVPDDEVKAGNPTSK